MPYSSLEKQKAYDDKLDAYLGMDRGVATRRLRKLILFDLLKRLGENICYRCQELIEDPEDMTMDHKEPWLWIDPAKFWDLTNVGFAHSKCNTAAGRRNARLTGKAFGPPS